MNQGKDRFWGAFKKVGTMEQYFGSTRGVGYLVKNEFPAGAELVVGAGRGHPEGAAFLVLVEPALQVIKNLSLGPTGRRTSFDDIPNINFLCLACLLIFGQHIKSALVVKKDVAVGEAVGLVKDRNYLLNSSGV